MYEESGYYDPNQVGFPQGAPNNNNMESLTMSNYSFGDIPNPNTNNVDRLPPPMGAALDHIQQHLGVQLDEDLHNHLIMPPEPPMPLLPNWDPNTQETLNHQLFDPSYSTPDHLLNFLHLPKCAPSIANTQLAIDIPLNSPSSRSLPFPLGFGRGELPGNGGPMLFDNVGYPPPQSHLLRDLFHSLPSQSNYGGLYGMEDREGGVGGSSLVFQEESGRQYENPVFDYRREMKVEKKNFPTEKQRRQQINCKYDVLRSLIPNLSKTDRASVVMGAIEYIEELQRTLKELKLLIDKKNHRRSLKRPKMEDDVTIAAAADMESSSMRPIVDEHDNILKGTIRSSWLQRKSPETLVDVRIVDDEANIKIIKKKKLNSLLLASKAVHELQLDIVHISTGFIGEHYIFFFNTKIFEGSSVYAGAIAKKLLDVMDRPITT